MQLFKIFYTLLIVAISLQDRIEARYVHEIPRNLTVNRNLKQTIETAGQWTPERANQWYSQFGFLRGANYINAASVNVLEFWQAATFNPEQVNSELQLANSLGFNVIRVFTHPALYQQDADGFFGRVDQFLTIARNNGIKTSLAIFDSCWVPTWQLGPQPDPIPGVHNSRWVQAPGPVGLNDNSQWQGLQDYTTAIVSRFATDDRVIYWDLWNEPNNGGTDINQITALLPLIYRAARAGNPSQPLTSGVWDGNDWGSQSSLTQLQQQQLLGSDIVTFHEYGDTTVFTNRVNSLKWLGRPIICTEYLNRDNPYNSNFATHIPIGQQNGVGMINWGLVTGRTQTKFPWDSAQNPYTDGRPFTWQHDIFNPDFTPYIGAETDYLKSIPPAPVF